MIFGGDWDCRYVFFRCFTPLISQLTSASTPRLRGGTPQGGVAVYAGEIGMLLREPVRHHAFFDFVLAIFWVFL